MKIMKPMPMKAFRRIASMFAAMALIATLSACSNTSLDSTLDTLVAYNNAQITWQQMSDDLDKGKASYAKNRAFFNVKEQKTIDAGLQAMDKSRAKLKQINQRQKAKKLVAVSQFIAAYSDAKKGYLLIRAVLMQRYDELSTNHQTQFNSFDNLAKSFDASVAKLTPKSVNSDNLQQLNSLISLSTQLLSLF